MASEEGEEDSTAGISPGLQSKCDANTTIATCNSASSIKQKRVAIFGTLHNTCLGGKTVKRAVWAEQKEGRVQTDCKQHLRLTPSQISLCLTTAMQREASVAAGECLSKATSQHRLCPQLPSSKKSLSKRGAISSHITYGPTRSLTQDMLTKQETQVLAIPLG